MQKITLRKAVKFFEDNIIMIASLEAKDEKGCAEKCLEVLRREISKNEPSESLEKDSSGTINNYVYDNVSWFTFVVGEVELRCISEQDAEVLLKICRKFGIECEQISESDYLYKPFWYVNEGELVITRYTLEKDSICACYMVSDYVAEHTR